MQQQHGSLDNYKTCHLLRPGRGCVNLSTIFTGGAAAGKAVVRALGKVGATKRLGPLERLAAKDGVGDLALRGVANGVGLVGEYAPKFGRQTRNVAKKKVSPGALGKGQHYKSLMGEEFEMPIEKYDPDVVSVMKRLWAMGRENAVRIDTRKIVEAAEKEVEQLLGTVRREGEMADNDGNITFDANAGPDIHRGVEDNKQNFEARQEKVYSLLGDLTLHQGDFGNTVEVINRLLGKNPATAKIGSMIPEVQALLKEETVRSLLESDKKAKKIFWLGQLVKHLISQQT